MTWNWKESLATAQAEGRPFYSDCSYSGAHWTQPATPFSHACHWCTKERFDVPYAIGRYEHTCSLCAKVTSVDVWANFVFEARARRASPDGSKADV